MATTTQQLMVAKKRIRISNPGGTIAESYKISTGIGRLAFIHSMKVSISGGITLGDYAVDWFLDQRDATNTSVEYNMTESDNIFSCLARGNFTYTSAGESVNLQRETVLYFEPPICLVRSPSLLVQGATSGGPIDIISEIYYTKKVVGQSEVTRLLKYWFGGESRGRMEPNRNNP